MDKEGSEDCVALLFCINIEICIVKKEKQSKDIIPSGASL